MKEGCGGKAVEVQITVEGVAMVEGGAEGGKERLRGSL